MARYALEPVAVELYANHQLRNVDRPTLVKHRNPLCITAEEVALEVNGENHWKVTVPWRTVRRLN